MLHDTNRLAKHCRKFAAFALAVAFLVLLCGMASAQCSCATGGGTCACPDMANCPGGCPTQFASTSDYILETRYRQVCNGGTCSVIPYTVMVARPRSAPQTFGSPVVSGSAVSLDSQTTFTVSLAQAATVEAGITEPSLATATLSVGCTTGGPTAINRPPILSLRPVQAAATVTQNIRDRAQTRQEGRHARREARHGCG